MWTACLPKVGSLSEWACIFGLLGSFKPRIPYDWGEIYTGQCCQGREFGMSFSRLPLYYNQSPIRGRDAAATQADRDLGNDRAKEMADKVAPYMLRRTSDILNKHLPPLSQLVVFCRPSETQVVASAGIRGRTQS